MHENALRKYFFVDKIRNITFNNKNTMNQSIRNVTFSFSIDSKNHRDRQSKNDNVTISFVKNNSSINEIFVRATLRFIRDSILRRQVMISRKRR